MAGSVAPAHAGGGGPRTVQLSDTADGQTLADGSIDSHSALTNANGSELVFTTFNPDRHDKRSYGDQVVVSAALDFVSGNAGQVCVFAMTTPFVEATRHNLAVRPYLGSQIPSNNNTNGCFNAVHGHNHLSISAPLAGLKFGQLGQVSLMLYAPNTRTNPQPNLVMWMREADCHLVPTITLTLGNAGPVG